MSAATEVLDFEKYKVADLKRLLKERGLSISGNKSELVQRLQAFEMSSENGAGDAVADEDELLKDGEDEDVDDEEAVEVKDEEVEDEAPVTEIKEPEPPKKIRLSSSPVEPSSTTPTKLESTDEEAGEAKKEIADKPEGPMAKRAERFGIQSADAKKLARAQRFGIPVTAKATNGKQSGGIKMSSGTPLTSEELEKLKKRAERFGTIVSEPLTKVAQDEKIRKRKERFGISTTAVSTTVVGSKDMDEKKRRRLERFGLSK